MIKFLNKKTKTSVFLYAVPLILMFLLFISLFFEDNFNFFPKYSTNIENIQTMDGSFYKDKYGDAWFKVDDELFKVTKIYASKFTAETEDMDSLDNEMYSKLINTEISIITSFTTKYTFNDMEYSHLNNEEDFNLIDKGVFILADDSMYINLKNYMKFTVYNLLKNDDFYKNNEFFYKFESISLLVFIIYLVASAFMIKVAEGNMDNKASLTNLGKIYGLGMILIPTLIFVLIANGVSYGKHGYILLYLSIFLLIWIFMPFITLINKQKLHYIKLDETNNAN